MNYVKETNPDANPSPERLPSKDFILLSFFLSPAGLDVREVRKGPMGYQKEKQSNQKKGMSSQIAVI